VPVGATALGAPGSSRAPVLPLAQLEKQAILETLSKLNGDKLLAARLLGIGKTTLYRKLKEYGINAPDTEGHVSNEDSAAPSP
jgi:transcriptional regulator of acetoin/glycerol metabolism